MATNIDINVILPVIFIIGSLFAGVILKRVVIRRLIALAKKTTTHLDNILLAVINDHVVTWSLVFGAYLAIKASIIPQNMIILLEKTIISLIIISVAFAVNKLVIEIIKDYSENNKKLRPINTLTQNISRIIIFTTSALILLNSLGISIVPILATLGVGGLAVALALQDTLSNLFAGFQIIATKQLKMGDYVRLQSGEEGYIIDIDWRATKIKRLPNDIVLIPNSKLNQAVVTNYSLPEKELAVLVNLRVHYNSDLERVEKVICEEAAHVQRYVQGGIPEFEPFIRYGEFGQSGIGVTVILRAKEFVDQYLLKHEFIKRLSKRFSKEGIVIPYPIRAINYAQEKQEIS